MINQYTHERTKQYMRTKAKRTLYASFENTTGGANGEIFRVRERSFLCHFGFFFGLLFFLVD